MQRLSDLDQKSNSIGFLRLAAALLVIIGHSFPYGGYGEDPLVMLTNNQHAFGRIAVDVFFCLSGFLIAWSYERTGDWRAYAWHRFLRIYPAFWVCLIVTGFVIAPLLSGQIGWAYVLQSLPLVTGVEDGIPGLFQDTPRSVVNGALWTLPWEVRAYIGLGLLGAFGLLRFRWITVLALIGAWAMTVYTIYSTPGIELNTAVSSAYRLMMFFLAGTAFYLFRDRIPMNWKLFAASVAVMVVGTAAGVLWVPFSAGLFYTLGPIPLTYAVFWLAMRLPFVRVNTKTDFSYGIYVYGTLFISVLASLGLNSLPWVLFVVIATALTLVVAAASWFFVEKPAMSFKNARVVRVDGKMRWLRHGHPKPSLVGSGSPTDV